MWPVKGLVKMEGNFCSPISMSSARWPDAVRHFGWCFIIKVTAIVNAHIKKTYQNTTPLSHFFSFQVWTASGVVFITLNWTHPPVARETKRPNKQGKRERQVSSSGSWRRSAGRERDTKAAAALRSEARFYFSRELGPRYDFVCWRSAGAASSRSPRLIHTQVSYVWLETYLAGLQCFLFLARHVGWVVRFRGHGKKKNICITTVWFSGSREIHFIPPASTVLKC